VRFLVEVAENALKTSAIIMIIVTTALFLSFVLGAIGLADIFRDAMLGLGFGPVGTLFVLVCGYLVLGMFMESFAMLMMTVPIVVPVVVALGFDPVWFGIFVTIVIEISLITPPVGINLYVVQSVRGEGSLLDIVFGVLPFLVSMLVMLVVLVAFPEIALWLPSLVY
jgi:TRAP-type C4-dicarboxylate transport system permease large subunit